MLDTLHVLCVLHLLYPTLSASRLMFFFFCFFFNDTATTEIYTLSLHDALPIYRSSSIRTARFLPAPPSIAKKSFTRTFQRRLSISPASASACSIIADQSYMRRRNTANRPAAIDAN